MSCKYKYRDFFIDIDKCIIKKNGKTVHMDFKQTWTILDCLLRAKVSGNGSVDLSALCISDTSKMLGRIKRVFGEDFYGRGLTGNIYINDPVTKIEAFPEELPFQTQPTNANSVPNFQKDNKKTSLQLLNPASIRLLPNTEKCFEQSLISANDQHVFFTISQDSNAAEIKNYIKNNRQTLLCQGGGCGKTVFLKRIEKELYKSNANEFVYYLSLGSLSHKQLTHLQEKYREYVYDRFDYESSIIISSIIQKYLDGKSECFEVFKTFGNSEHNPVLLLLDGLNEVPSSIYSQIVYEITQLQGLHFSIILSSRNTDIPLELQNFKRAYLSKVPEQLKSALINKMDSKKQPVSLFIKQIINIPFYYGLMGDMLSKKTNVPKNEYELLDLCYMEYSLEHIKRLVNNGEEFEILCGVYYCIIPLLAYNMLKPNAVYSIGKAELEEKINFIVSEKELCSIVLRTYMPKHFSSTIEIHKNYTKKYLNCLVNQSLLSCENNIYSFKHQNWADYHAASVVVSIIKAYQQNLVTSAEAAKDLLCLNLPNSALHYIGEVLDLNEDTKISDNAVASLKNIFSGLKKLENIQDIKPEHVYYASILNLFLEFKRNVSVNDKTSPVIEEIVDRVISPLYLKFKRDVTSCAYLQEALDNNPCFTEAVRIELASLIFQKIQVYSVKSASAPLQEITTRAREYVAFANGVYPLDSVANMDARIDLRTAEDEILQYDRPHNAKAFFDTGYRKLEELALNRVTVSCNLLALICSFPSPYLVRSSVVNRANYKKAFTLYASAIVGKENKGDIILYSIRNMIALLLRGYIQVDNSSLDFYDLTDPNMLRIGSCDENNIYDFAPCNNESLLLAKKLYNKSVGYYRPLMYFYGACIDVMQKDPDSALEKLKAEIELSSKLSAQFTLQPKILYNHLTGSDTYDVSSDYRLLKAKLLDKNSQKFWHFDSVYYYLDVKRLELSINDERRDFFKRFECELDFDSLGNIRKCENLIAESINKTH